MEYKRANLNHLQQLINMRLDFLHENFGVLDEKMESHIRRHLEDYFVRHLNRDVFAYLAIDGQAVGMGMLITCEKPANPNFIDGRTGLVMNIYTCKQYRRQGIARGIMEMLIEDSRNMRLDCLELEATEGGYGLYKKLGFKERQSGNKDMALALR